MSNWNDIFRERRVIWEGGAASACHAAYALPGFAASGKHSDYYFNSEEVYAQPDLLQRAVQHFAALLRARGIKPDGIATWLYGAPFAHALATELLVPILDMAPRKKVLIVGDDIHSGGSVTKVKTGIEQSGGTVIGPLCVLGNFSGKKHFEGLSIEALITHEPTLYAAEDCPLCKAGSEALPARAAWARLINS